MTTWSKQTKHTASWSHPNQSASTWTKTNRSPGVNFFLLQESGFFLLLEDGVSKIILDQSDATAPFWMHESQS